MYTLSIAEITCVSSFERSTEIRVCLSVLENENDLEKEIWALKKFIKGR